MQILDLHYETPLKSHFELKELNFLFVFQVNCPGCFLYGIPMVNKLFNTYGKQVSFLGLSTAFEDFEYNNEANTKLLLDKNETVGETKKAFENENIDISLLPIEFPVAMDLKACSSFDYNKGAETICKINPDYIIWPEFEKIALKNKVITFLKDQEKISLTFTLNQMRGTPTMIVFNNKHEILYHKFGHTTYEELNKNLSRLINSFDKK